MFSFFVETRDCLGRVLAIFYFISEYLYAYCSSAYFSHPSFSAICRMHQSLSVSPLFDAADFPLFVARARVCAELVTAMAADVNAAAACKDDDDDDAVVLELKRTALGMLLTVALIFHLDTCLCCFVMPSDQSNKLCSCFASFHPTWCAHHFSQTPGLASSSSHAYTRCRRVSLASHTCGRRRPPSSSHQCAPTWRLESCTQ